MNTSFSYFNAPISNKTPDCDINIRSLHRFITTHPQLKEATERVRAELPDKKRFAYAKTHLLPYVTPGGHFAVRSRQGLTLPSGLFVIDLDHLGSFEEACRLRDALAADRNLGAQLCFVSPGRCGVKAFVPIRIHAHLTVEQSLEMALEGYWSYIELAYGVKPDDANKDISRACLLCHDPEAKLCV